MALDANFFELDLVAHHLDGAGIGSDENDLGVGERLRKSCPLGQKAVSGMHGFRAGFLAGGDDFVDQQIGLRSGRRPKMNRLIRHFDMKRVGVGVGINGDSRDTHFARGLDDAAGDFAAIGDQNFSKHSRPDFEKRALSLIPAAPGPADACCYS